MTKHLSYRARDQPESGSASQFRKEKSYQGDAHDEHHHKAEGTHLVESLRTEQCQEQIEKRKETGEYDDLSQYGVTTVVIADAFFQGDGFERFENAIGLRRDDFAPVNNTFSGLNNTVGESDSL